MGNGLKPISKLGRGHTGKCRPPNRFFPPVEHRSPDRPCYVSLSHLGLQGDSLFDGDVLLFRRGRSLVRYLIGQAGRTIYSHAGVARDLSPRAAD